MFRGLPNDAIDGLGSLNMPHTLNRIRGATYLFEEVSASNKDWQNQSFLRAGFSEFRSVKDALAWDLGRQRNFTPEESKNPLVHFLYRMRRISVYLGSPETESEWVEIPTRWDGKDSKWPAQIVKLKKVEEYLRREKLDRYQSSDISGICEWIERMQSGFGISTVLVVGIYFYAIELIDHYS